MDVGGVESTYKPSVAFGEDKAKKVSRPAFRLFPVK